MTGCTTNTESDQNKKPRRQVYDAAVRGDHDRRVMHINYTMEDAEMQTDMRKPRHPAIIYLSEYKDKTKRIDALRNELARIREMATSVTVRANADRVTGSKARDSMANHAVRAVDVERRLEIMIEHLQECLDMRLFLIEQMDAPEEEKLVLTYRYINCMLWEEIQHKMHYGATYTYQLHGRALQSFWKTYQAFQNAEKSE